MNFQVDMDGCRQSLDIDGWIHAGMPWFENEVADVTRCTQIGVVPFSDAYIRHVQTSIDIWLHGAWGWVRPGYQFICMSAMGSIGQHKSIPVLYGIEVFYLYPGMSTDVLDHNLNINYYQSDKKNNKNSRWDSSLQNESHRAMSGLSIHLQPQWIQLLQRCMHTGRCLWFNYT
jgi:hypothetical protein